MGKVNHTDPVTAVQCAESLMIDSNTRIALALAGGTQGYLKFRSKKRTSYAPMSDDPVQEYNDPAKWNRRVIGAAPDTAKPTSQANSSVARRKARSDLTMQAPTRVRGFHSVNLKSKLSQVSSQAEDETRNGASTSQINDVDENHRAVADGSLTDSMREALRNNRFGPIRVAALRAFLSSVGVEARGSEKKAQLITRVKEHFESEFLNGPTLIATFQDMDENQPPVPTTATPAKSPNSKRKARAEKLKQSLKKIEEKNARQLLLQQKKTIAAAKKKEKEDRKAAKAVEATHVAAEKAERAATRLTWPEVDSLAAISLAQEAHLMHEDTSKTSVGFVPLNAFKTAYVAKENHHDRFNLQQYTGEQIETHIKNISAAFKIIHDKCAGTGGGGLHDQMAIKGMSQSVYDALLNLYEDNEAVTGPLRNESGQVYVTHDVRSLPSTVENANVSVGNAVGSLGVGNDSLDGELEDGVNSETDSDYSEHEQQHRKTLRLRQESHSLLKTSVVGVAYFDDDMPFLLADEDDDSDIPLLPPALAVHHAATAPDRGSPSTASTAPSQTVNTPVSRAPSAAVPHPLSMPAPRAPTTATPRAPVTAAPRTSSSSKRPPAGEAKYSGKRRKFDEDAINEQHNEWMQRSQAASDRTARAMEAAMTRPSLLEQLAQAALPLIPTMMDYFFNRSTSSGGNSSHSNQRDGYVGGYGRYVGGEQRIGGGHGENGGFVGSQRTGFGGSENRAFVGNHRAGFGGNENSGFVGSVNGGSAENPFGGIRGSRHVPWHGNSVHDEFGVNNYGGFGGSSYGESSAGGEGSAVDTHDLGFVDLLNNPFIQADKEAEREE
ncbi:hypothetical protein HDU98_009900 [Podochytrium sp. JEL0797]|nr:hypothetical protein HDU98_009900 [Podochytrium sp. JEL0797]